MNNTAKRFDILTTGLNVLYNYFDSNINFLICIQIKFSFSKIVLSVYAIRLLHNYHSLHKYSIARS